MVFGDYLNDIKTSGDMVPFPGVLLTYFSPGAAILLKLAFMYRFKQAVYRVYHYLKISKLLIKGRFKNSANLSPLCR